MEIKEKIKILEANIRKKDNDITVLTGLLEVRSRPAPSPQPTNHNPECIHNRVCKYECDEGDFDHPCPHRVSTYNPEHDNQIRNATIDEFKKWNPFVQSFKDFCESIRSKEQP